MLIKKKLLYIAVNEISTKAFAVHNWVCGQGVGERPNQEVHPGHTINLSPNEQHLVLIKRTSGYPEINMFTPSGWNWLLLALVGGEGRLYEKSNSHPCSGWADKFFLRFTVLSNAQVWLSFFTNILVSAVAALKNMTLPIVQILQ